MSSPAGAWAHTGFPSITIPAETGILLFIFLLLKVSTGSDPNLFPGRYAVLLPPQRRPRHDKSESNACQFMIAKALK